MLSVKLLNGTALNWIELRDNLLWQNSSHFANNWHDVSSWVWIEQLVRLLGESRHNLTAPHSSRAQTVFHIVTQFFIHIHILHMLCPYPQNIIDWCSDMYILPVALPSSQSSFRARKIVLSQSRSQWRSQALGQCISHSGSHLVAHSLTRAVSYSLTQALSHSDRQLGIQSVTRSVSQSVTQAVSYSPINSLRLTQSGV